MSSDTEPARACAHAPAPAPAPAPPPARGTKRALSDDDDPPTGGLISPYYCTGCRQTLTKEDFLPYNLEHNHHRCNVCMNAIRADSRARRGLPPVKEKTPEMMRARRLLKKVRRNARYAKKPAPTLTEDDIIALMLKADMKSQMSGKPIQDNLETIVPIKLDEPISWPYNCLLVSSSEASHWERIWHRCLPEDVAGGGEVSETDSEEKLEDPPAADPSPTRGMQLTEAMFEFISTVKRLYAE